MRTRSICTVLGCESHVKSHGLCAMHHGRFKKHGHTEQTRPVDWGKREKNPLYQSWRHIARKSPYGMEPIWNDFDSFLRDVGERPSDSYRLCVQDNSKPFGPENFQWREKQLSPRTADQKFDHAKYIREYRKIHPERFHSYDLKRSFGITLDEYSKMLESQGGVCAICKNPETTTHTSKSVDGYVQKIRRLSVDHCHDKGHIRGLLCTACNQGIGNLKNNSDYCISAAIYLENTKDAKS